MAQLMGHATGHVTGPWMTTPAGLDTPQWRPLLPMLAYLGLRELQRWQAQTRAPRELATLSARERQVLALVAEGQGNKDIARQLGLSPHTVKRHVTHILDKLDLSSRGRAAALYQASLSA